MTTGARTRLALVTGGAGFIGHHLVARLLADGVRVRNIDFAASRHRSPLLEDWQGSFRDPARLREALVGVDAVFHLAATRFPADANRDPCADAEENVVGTLALLDLAVERGVRRVVFCSSGGTVYGPSSAPLIPEDHPTNPITAYGIGKLAIEKYLRLYAAQHGIGTVALRVANPYGPHQSVAKAQGALTTFCHKAVRGDEIEIWGDGRVERDFVHISDVAAALVAAARADASGIEVNIGSGHGTSLNDLIATIAGVLGRPVAHRHLPGRAFDVPRNVLDIALADRLLGWQPTIPLRDGIEELVRDLSSDRV